MKNSILYKIAKIVANRYEVDPKFIFQNSRKRKIVDMRAIFHYMCYLYSTEKLKTIGAFSKEMGREEPHHHASIVYAIKKVKGFIEFDPKIREDVASIESQIQKQISYDRYVSKKAAITISHIIDKIFYEEDYEYLSSLDSLINLLYEKKNKIDIEHLIKTQETINERVHQTASDNSELGVV